MMNKCINLILLTEIVLHILLTVVSLVFSSAGFPVKNIYSPEGIRWAFMNSVSNVLTPTLFYLIGLILVIGIYRRSGFHDALLQLGVRRREFPLSYRQLRALIIAAIFFLFLLVLLLFLIISPRAVLVSVSGCLFPSPFSKGLIPAIMVGLALVFLTYGVVSNTLRTFHEVFLSLYIGLGDYAGWILVYLFGAHTYASFMYIFPNIAGL